MISNSWHGSLNCPNSFTLTPLKKLTANPFLLFFPIFCLLNCSTNQTTQLEELSGDLIVHIENIVLQMPGRTSEGFVKPTAGQLNKWRNLIVLFLDGNLDEVQSIIDTEFPFYHLLRYRDTGFASGVYYLPEEKLPIEKGWGTYVLNSNPKRAICVQSPHPLYDINTHIETAGIFRRSGTLFFMMAGTHRCANFEVSQCDGTFRGCGGDRYPVSDMAHVVTSVFQVTHEVVSEYESQIYSFSIHGHNSPECEDVFISNGLGGGPKQILFDLEVNLKNTGLTVVVAGDSVSHCPLVGSTNVQGRFINGSAQPCTSPGVTPAGYFIHIEQSRLVRDNFSEYSKLIEAIRLTIKEK